jgi:hypothetical protein
VRVARPDGAKDARDFAHGVSSRRGGSPTVDSPSRPLPPPSSAKDQRFGPTDLSSIWRDIRPGHCTPAGR